MGHPARVELVLDCAEPANLATFWRQALDYREYYADAHLVVLVPREGFAAPLLLQGGPEPKAGKNRMHLDIVAADIEAEVPAAGTGRASHRRRRAARRRHEVGQDVGPRAERVLCLHRR
jgi:hypothetical protein